MSGIPENYVTGILFKETPHPSIIQKLNNLKFNFQITRTRYIPLKWPNILWLENHNIAHPGDFEFTNSVLFRQMMSII